MFLGKSKAIAQLTAVLIVVVIILAGVAATGWLINPMSAGKATTITLTSTTTSTTTAAQSSLIAEAQAEGGTLTLYTSHAAAATNAIVSEFESAYPWAKVTAQVLNPSDMYTKLAAENSTGKHVADLVFVSPDAMLVFYQGGLLMNYTSPYQAAEGWPPSPPDVINPMTQQTDGVAINTNLVPASQVPKNWTDFGNAFWKGKIATDSPAKLGGAGEVFAGLYPVMGNASWTQLMEAINANDITNYAHGSEAESAIVTGQKAVDIGIPYAAYLTDVQAGAPLQWVWLNPTFSHATDLSIVQGAPHPYMAMLFFNWMTSIVGQQSIQSESDISILPIVAHTNSTLLPANISLIPVTSIYTNPQYWTNVMTGIFGNQTTG